MKIFALYAFLAVLTKEAYGMRHLIYWNKKSIPELQNGGLEITVEVDDWMDVLCPYYANLDNSVILPAADYLFLYNVTEYEFQSCDTRRGNRVQDCNDPLTEKKLTTKFQERSPSPFGFTFRPDETYYYISKPTEVGTSKGCTSSTLKMIVNVKRKGTVFDPEDRTTKVYHEKSKTESSEKLSFTGNNKSPKHHHHHRHHHDKTTVPSTTTVSKPAYQVINRVKMASRTKKNPPRNTSSSVLTGNVTHLLILCHFISMWLSISR